MYSHLLQSCGGPSASGKAKPGVHYGLNARDIPFILETVRKLSPCIILYISTYVRMYFMYVHTYVSTYVMCIQVYRHSGGNTGHTYGIHMHVCIYV